jgi:hypothetical protein
VGVNTPERDALEVAHWEDEGEGEEVGDGEGRAEAVWMEVRVERVVDVKDPRAE